jgi:putative oxidoreductase
MQTFGSGEPMQFLINLGNKILDFAGAFAFVGPLLARITVGWVFVTSGLGKIQHIDRVIGFFASLGIPAPAFLAPLTAYTELVAGALLIAGLGTRIAAIALGIIMVVALKTAPAADIGGFSDLVGVIEFIYLVILVWLAVAGPGKVSLDSLISQKYRKRGG